MRKGCLILAAAAAFLTACSREPEVVSTGYLFTVKGVQVQPGMETAEFIEDLGEPVSCFSTKSCAFDGEDRAYTYGGFELDAYTDEDGVERVSAIILRDDSVATEEGIMIGDPEEKIREVYGEPDVAQGNLLTYEKDGTQLRFIVQDEDVVSIEYILKNGE